MESPRPLSVCVVIAIHVVVLASIAAAAAIGARVAAGAAAGGYAIALAALAWRARRLMRGTSEVAGLIDRGQDEEALSSLEALAAAARWVPDLHAVLLHRQATFHLATGALDRARALDQAAVRSGWLEVRSARRYLSEACAELAVIAALHDAADETASWRTRAGAATPDDPGGAKLFMDGILLARRGAYAEARRLILGASGVRIAPYRARVLQWIVAMCEAQSGVTSDKTLAAARSATREVLALATAWPELAAFVRDHAATA